MSFQRLKLANIGISAGDMDMERCWKVTSMVYNDNITFPKSTEVFRSMTFDDVWICHFRVFLSSSIIWCAVFKFSICYSCVSKSKEKMKIFYHFFILPKWSVGIVFFIVFLRSLGSETLLSLIAALACSDTKLLVNSHFGHFLGQWPNLRAWLEKPGGLGGIFPSGPHQFHFLGGTRGTQYIYITKMGPFTSLGLFFSNCNSCIGGFGPFETLEDPFPRRPPGPSPLHLWNHFSSLASEVTGGP